MSVGDTVSEGSLLLTLRSARRAPTAAARPRRRVAAAAPSDGGGGSPTAGDAAPGRGRQAADAPGRRRAPAPAGRGRRAAPRRGRAERARRPRAGPCYAGPGVAAAGPRARRRPRRRCRARAARAASPRPTSRRPRRGPAPRQRRRAKAAPAADGAGRGPRAPAVAEGRLREVRPGRARSRCRGSRRSAGPELHRNWVMIPHVTHYDEADITELEAFRKRTNEEYAKQGVKLTMVALLLKACVASLQAVPGVQRLARRRRPRPQALLPPRLRGRHAAGPRRAGHHATSTRRA